MTTDAQRIALEYLDDFKIKEDHYIIGVNQPGRTIHKQQKRALNLFYALRTTGKIKENTTIAIIGGGIAGLTFASVALRSKTYVKIYETMPSFLPYQKDSKDREIHPNAYDYPIEGSLELRTKLPVLNWGCGPVDKFWNDITSQFQNYQDNMENLFGVKYFTSYLNCGKIEIEPLRGKYHVKTELDKNQDGFYDIIIYAVGYGVEISKNTDNPKYWNNNIFSQIESEGRKYLVSGTGDGALMDVIKLRVINHGYSDLLGALKNGPKGFELETDLAEIRSDYFKKDKQNDNFIYEAFNNIPELHYAHVAKNLKYSEKTVILNGRKELEESLNLDNVSLLNAFLIFILKKYDDKLSYKTGDLIYETSPLKCLITGHPEDYISDRTVIIMRHGTHIEKGLNEVPGLLHSYQTSQAIIRQKGHSKEGLVEPIWPEDYYTNLFADALFDLIDKTAGHALPALETYTTILKHNLLLGSKKKKVDFRISLHKVTKIGGSNLVHRQITHFVGSNELVSNGGFSRYYSSDVGIVGYTVQSGEPCIIKTKGGDENFREYLKLFPWKDPEDSDKIYEGNKRSFFTFPICAPCPCILLNGDKRADAPCLILLIDADDENFFDTKEIIDIILSTTTGLIVALETNIARKNLEMDDVKPHSYPISKTYKMEAIKGNNTFFDKKKGYKYLMERWGSKVHYEKYRFKKFLSFSNSKDNK